MQNKKIIKSSILIIVLTILGKAMAFVRDALIAAKFGATYITDVYMFSIGVVMLLTTIGYGLTTTLIPMHTQYIENKTQDERNKFISNLLNTSGLITIVFVIISIVISPYIVKMFAPGFYENPKVFEQAVHILRIMFVSLIFVCMQSIVTGVLQAHKEFLEPAAMAFVQNIITVIYIILLSSLYGMNGFAIATVTGFAGQFIINVPKFKKLGYKYSLTIDFKDRDIIKLLKLMMPIIVSTSIIQINLFITRYFATTLQEGAVAALDFSNKLNMLVYEVFAVAISMVVYPTLATYVAQKNKEEYKKAIIKAFNIILLIMVPASVAVLILREPVISIIFERGAFNRDAVKLTATALMFYTPAMIAYGVRDILYKGFYSIQDSKSPMINSFFAIALNFILSFILVKFMGVSGLALASTISTVITTLTLILLLNKRLEGINLKKLIEVFIKVSVSSLIMGLVILNIRNICLAKMGMNFLSNIIIIGISFVVGVIVYFISIRLFKVEECMEFMQILKRKIK